ncbi:MAG: HDOD domain-containing protein [Planctomycetes bacterium]|nr:HDOD domain-containing protein [Planctomycetota bacterium]
MDMLIGDRTPAANPSSRSDSSTAVGLLEPEQEAPESADDQDAEEWWRPADAEHTQRVPIADPNLTTEARALENMLISQFDGHDLSLPPLPRVPETVLRKLRKRKCSLPEIAVDISEDQVSAASVLRMSNSPLYRGMNKITSLEMAVVRLGSNAIKTLMLHQSMRSATFEQGGGNAKLAEMLSLRAVASAYIMRELAELTDVDSEEAFMIGLLHDIGNVMVLRTANSLHKLSKFDIDLDAFEYLCQETHLEFGELIAESWGLPDHIRTLISTHHTYPEPSDPLRKERLLIDVTDMISSLLTFTPYEPYDLLNCQAVIDLGFSERPEFGALLERIPEDLEEVLNFF